jgi:hypothetical protein
MTLNGVRRLNFEIDCYIDEVMNKELIDLQKDFQLEQYSLYSKEKYEDFDKEEYINEQLIFQYFNDYGNGQNNFYEWLENTNFQTGRLTIRDTLWMINYINKYFDELSGEHYNFGNTEIDDLINVYAYTYAEQIKDILLNKYSPKIDKILVAMPVNPNHPHPCVVCMEGRELYGICSKCVSGKICIVCADKMTNGHNEPLECPVCRGDFDNTDTRKGMPINSVFIDWHTSMMRCGKQLKGN